MNILEQIAAKAQRGDTGMSLHYGFLYSCIVGMETKNVFEFGSGFSTHVILHALEKTGGTLTSCDVTNYSDNPNITDFTKASKRWNFYHGNSNELFADDVEFQQYDVILHDGSHIGSEVLVDLNNIYPYLKHDGILITHDTRHHTLGDGMMGAAVEFAKDKDLEMCTLPYGYGLTFFRNKGNVDNAVNLTWRKRS
jgi:predicted O-methyltransferase YrrM|tara:strand:- start:264 stop:848 length:585 start_codon:yes stop_codon:yes gene_type:complete